mmetsp:Transcript_138822/g.431864  ORF Transcript_138822/g.431864 Transcript_138822/m.431864 type:complete len:561 (+) Transcript_138822:105-1787(+)
MWCSPLCVRLTPAPAAPEGDALAECNYFPSRSCALTTNSFATWDASAPRLAFHTSVDERTGQATSTLWPPGWGSSGRTPKVPSCTSCSLWRPPTVLHRSPEDCDEAGPGGGGGVRMDQGGCCSSPSGVCPGYCCNAELYFGTMVGVASDTGDRLFLAAQMGKASEVMPHQGRTFGTYGVSVRTAGASTLPEDWTYESDRMPGTRVWPWSNWNESTQFFSAMSRARASSQFDLVYLLGFMGRWRVLARANLTDLLDFRWRHVEFLADGHVWQPYTNSAIPALALLWEYHSSETSLHYDERVHKWIVPEVRARDKTVVFRVAPAIAGPYEEVVVGPVPMDALQSDPENCDVRAVKSHPEFASAGCPWVLSVVLHWRSQDTPPPKPGLHRFPRMLCVRGELSMAATPGRRVPPAGDAAGAACGPASLRTVVDGMACGMDSGCHSCGSRAKYLVHTEGSTLQAACGTVAAQFPEACGALARCGAEQLRAAVLLEAWAAGQGPGATALAAARPVFAPGKLAALVLLAALALAGLAARRRRRAWVLLEDAAGGLADPRSQSPGGTA